MRERGRLRRAVFLDRDGVLNGNIFYADTGCWEAPRNACEFALLPGVIAALRQLRDAGFLLFVVSNQPNVAKGKSSPEAFAAMRDRLAAALGAAGVPLTDAFYCLHHPHFTGACRCRKPEPYFLQAAAHDHALVLKECWMVGDRATDMECGRRAGVYTAWVCTGQEPDEPDAELCDITAASLPGAVAGILASAGHRAAS